MAEIMTIEEARAESERLFEKLGSDDPALRKDAVDRINDFTRTKMREDGFYRRILPPVPITNDELDRLPWSDKPYKVVDKEPNSPAAVSIPFATLPTNLYIRAPRYVVAFARITTPRFTKDVDELRTWIMDIRTVLSDNSIKDMLAEEDSRFLSAVNTAIVGEGVIVPASGVAQYVNVVGGITRETFWESMKVLPGTPASLEAHTVLMNHLTIKDVCKFGRNEMGGNLAEDIMRTGWSLQEFGGKQLLITIKKGLVPNSHMFHFADPKFIGKSYELEATTMYVKREFYLLEFFSYETIGGAIGNTSSVARLHFS